MYKSRELCRQDRRRIEGAVKGIDPFSETTRSESWQSRIYRGLNPQLIPTRNIYKPNSSVSSTIHKHPPLQSLLTTHPYRSTSSLQLTPKHFILSRSNETIQNAYQRINNFRPLPRRSRGRAIKSQGRPRGRVQPTSRHRA